MRELIDLIFTPEFMPHGHCYFWQPALLWLNVSADFLIFLAYGSIPLAILYLRRRRRDLVPLSIVYLFIAFITACGLVHLIAVWNVWHSAYWLAGLLKMLTAAASVATAIALWIFMPRFLGSPTFSRLKQEIDEKNAAMSALKDERFYLEQRVKERTSSLEAKNEELLKEKQHLEALQAVTVDRELTMVGLKKEVNELLAELERPEKYVLSIPMVGI